MAYFRKNRELRLCQKIYIRPFIKLSDDYKSKIWVAEHFLGKIKRHEINSYIYFNKYLRDDIFGKCIDIFGVYVIHLYYVNKYFIPEDIFQHNIKITV